MFPTQQGAVRYALQSLSLSIPCCSPGLRSLRPEEPLGLRSTLQTPGYPTRCVGVGCSHLLQLRRRCLRCSLQSVPWPLADTIWAKSCSNALIFFFFLLFLNLCLCFHKKTFQKIFLKVLFVQFYKNHSKRRDDIATRALIYYLLDLS